MALTTGTRLGAYEILGVIGAGGMGEVYRGRDMKLNRDVALKVLPDAFATDPDRLSRFRREAQVLASLNHPNIAQIYGFEDSGATHALVMELVPGPTLAEILSGTGHSALGTGQQQPMPGAQRPVPLGEVLQIARQIADALEAAHETGIIHRDLKPANVKIKDDGTVKVLDFGLAKAMDPIARRPEVGGAGDAAHRSGRAAYESPTMTSPAMTEMGVILGTAAYMSPEQAKGKAVDKRADIWAFGVLLWEMLTGQALFAGETMSETLAAVIKDEPRLDRLPADTPRAVRRLLARCLERDPKLRLRDIGEARIALGQPDEGEGAAASGRVLRPPRRRAWTLATGGLALAAATGVIVWRAKPVTDVPVRRFELPAAMGTANFAMAPDGSRLAYLADGHLYVHAFDVASLEAQDLGRFHVTTATLFWSPDSRNIGFTAENRLRSVPAAGGPIFEIAKLPGSGGTLDLAWQPDGTILFSAWRDSLYRVPASGGTPEVFVTVDPATEIDFHSISVVPGNRVVVTTHLRKSEASYRVELIDQARKRTVLMADAPVTGAQYVPQGYLLLNRLGANEGIWAVPFSERPIDLAGAVLVHSGAAAFSAANDGTLLLFARRPASKSELVWVDRKGTVSPLAGPALVLGSSLSLSPDGRRVVLYATADSGSALVVRNLDSGADTQLGGREAGRGLGRQGVPAHPTWFPSGDRIVHAIGAVEAARIMARHADGSGTARDLAAGRFARVSPDGRHLLYIEDDRGRGRLRYAVFLPDGGIGSPQPLFAGADEPNVNWFDLSPDGSMLAYAVTQENSQSNIFLTGFPSASGRWTVTTDGGTRPRFSRDGRELYFAAPAASGTSGPSRGRLNVMPVTLSPTVKLGAAAPLFEEGSREAGRTRGSGASASQAQALPEAGVLNILAFDVARDGRFLMSRLVDPAAADARRLVLVQNWIAAIRK